MKFPGIVLFGVKIRSALLKSMSVEFQIPEGCLIQMVRLNGKTTVFGVPVDAVSFDGKLTTSLTTYQTLMERFRQHFSLIRLKRVLDIPLIFSPPTLIQIRDPMADQCLKYIRH